MRLARETIGFDRLERDGKAEIFDRWLSRWRTKLTHLSSGGGGDSYEIYDVEGPVEAIAEIPHDMRVYSVWTNPPKLGRGGRRKIRFSK
jgi:hypothetical protein